MTAEVGSYRWMAPEVAQHFQYGPAADLYNYAMVLLELLTRQLPWASVASSLQAASNAMGGLRPPLPGGTPLPFAALVQRCWSADPAARPSFEEAGDELQCVFHALEPAEAEWLDASGGHPFDLEATGAPDWVGQLAQD